MLKGKLALVTGTKSGIGNSILKIFAENKANIIACARERDKYFEEECNQLSEKHSVNIYPTYFDLGEEENLKLEVNKILLAHKKIDILVNNAGEIETSAFLMTKLDTFKKIFQVNFHSPVLLMQMVLKNMIKNKSGSIINLSSISAFESNEGRSAYSASKSALNSISKTIARELGKVNIRVNNVAPGIIDTKMLNSNTNKEIIKELINKSSLKRVGSPNEVANTILFLASDLSSYISGETIKVDGGM
tara:strand:- start:848 stop:1588 length:741 start_codon:yes stop_codon:yes gene_type:complete